MDNAVAEFCEPLFVFHIIEGFGIARMRERGFGKYELVDDLVEGVEPDLKKVKLVEKTEAVVDHSSLPLVTVFNAGIY